jgi:phosphonate transport system substrate-binding protein
VTRMEGKKMIPAGQIRYVWKSPKLPSSPWAIPTDLPASLRSEARAALVALPTNAPQVWKDLLDGQSTGVQEITHAEYEPIIRMIKANQVARRDGKSK